MSEIAVKIACSFVNDKISAMFEMATDSFDITLAVYVYINISSRISF